MPTVGVEIFFVLFFFNGSFKREKESEKERKEREL